MRLDGLPSYEKKYRGKVYHHVGTFDSDNSLYVNKKEAKNVTEQYAAHGKKCIMERHGKGFSVYVCDS